MKQLRFDVIEPMPLEWKKGMFTGTAVFARSGVQIYQSPSGKLVREFRPPEEVKKSAKQFQDCPITLEHPPEMLTESSVEQYIVGVTGDVEFDTNLLRGKTSIFRRDAINAVLTTHKQLSAGYTCDIEESSGVWVDVEGIAGVKGKEYPYDYIQRNIESNHLAIVQKARAGDIATFDSESNQHLIRDFENCLASQRFDSVETFYFDGGNSLMDMIDMEFGEGYGTMSVPKSLKDMYEKGDMMLTKDMMTMDMGGSMMKMPSSVANAVKSLQSNLAQLEKDKSDMKMSYDQMKTAYEDMASKLKARGDALSEQEANSVSLEAYQQEKLNRQKAEARADAVQSALQTEREKNQSRNDEETLQNEVTARLDAYQACQRFLEDVPSFDATKTAQDWKKMAIAAKTPSVKLDSLDAGEINIRFDMLVQLTPEEDYQARSSNQKASIEMADKVLSEATARTRSNQETYKMQLPQDVPGVFSAK